MVKSELLSVSLGPVQSFIATARRTQDLWMGSQLLSHLALVGLHEIARLGGDTVQYITPAKDAEQWPADIPNRFMVAVPAGAGADLGIAIEAAINTAWRNQVAMEVWQRCFAPYTPLPAFDLWRQQIREWPDVYWTVWPVDETADYTATYRQASLALNARKQLRDFPTYPAHDEKCTLCGLRAALHAPGETSRREVRTFWDAWRQRLGDFVVRTGERLCALCAIKRLAARAEVQLAGRRLRPAERFPSTASVATLPFKLQLMQHWDTVHDAATAHLDALNRLHAQSGAPFAQPEEFPYAATWITARPEVERLLKYDGDFFYPENLAPEQLPDLLGRVPDERDRRAALRAGSTLRGLLTAVADLPGTPPHPYLAVLALDGDRMGQLLGDCHNLPQHQAISQALAHFAHVDVPRIVQIDYAGRLIYAGGDDVLALAPVTHALAMADALRQGLTAALSACGYPGRTASAGVAIIHHTHTLEGALAAARAAEHAAKHTYDRNALVLTFLRRSGEPTTMGLHWDYPSDTLVPLPLLQDLQDRFATNVLSSKLAYDLRAEGAALAALPPVGQQAELTRLLTRHWARHPMPEVDKAVLPVLAERLTELAAHIGIETLAEWLLLLRFLAQGGEEV